MQAKSSVGIKTRRMTDEKRFVRWCGGVVDRSSSGRYEYGLTGNELSGQVRLSETYRSPPTCALEECGDERSLIGINLDIA